MSRQASVVPNAEDAPMEEEDFGSDLELDEELENILVNVETEATAVGLMKRSTTDIEEIVPRISPFLEFRRKGWLSVSDLVGLIWCEVQYDYRLRSLPYLPPDQRPDVITSKLGTAIPVNRAKVEDKEKILRRGEKIHKRLEREIHPEEIVVHAVSREDVWGLRFLNMFSAFEALLTIGKCRELPVVGFVQGVLVMGVIDEITRVPIDDSNTRRNTRSNVPGMNQTSLTSFFSPTKARSTLKRERTHRLFVSDSKTRASGTIPKESDTLAGRLQVMLYKELLDALLLPPRDLSNEKPISSDAILPSETPFSWERLFEHLRLDTKADFSDEFVYQSRPIISGNGLRYDVIAARTITDMVTCWVAYVAALGLGTSSSPSQIADKNMGRTEDRLELVYRRAGAKHRKRSDKPTKSGQTTRSRKDKRRSSVIDQSEPETAPYNENAAGQYAIVESLQESIENQGINGHFGSQSIIEPSSNDENAEDELAWAVEMSLDSAAKDMSVETSNEVTLRASQVSVTDSPKSLSSPLSSTPASTAKPAIKSDSLHSPPPVETTKGSSASESGSIIGRTVFTHSPRRLTAHLSSVLRWWMGEREAVGVSIEETSRCAWCEFEEACEWRSQKAREAVDRAKLSRSAHALAS